MVNGNKALWGIKVYVKKSTKECVLYYCKLINYHFKLDFQKVDQQSGGKWLIHSIEHLQDNQLQSLIYTWYKIYIEVQAITSQYVEQCVWLIYDIHV